MTPPPREALWSFSKETKETPVWGHPPESELAALMECEPGQEPPVSSPQSVKQREEMLAIVNQLPKLQRTVIELMFYERRSTRSTASVLRISKSEVHRIKQAALANLASRCGPFLSQTSRQG